MRAGMVRIKMCGITSIEDAEKAVSLGVDFLGFVFTESPRQIAARQAEAIRKSVAGQIKIVGVFANVSCEEDILAVSNLVPLDFIQIHGPWTNGKKIEPQKIIRAVRVKPDMSWEALREYPDFYALLFDTYSKTLMGGTGRAFDWPLLENVPKDRRVILAGGLTPKNIFKAVSTVQPYGVDVSSGIEKTPGRKDHEKMECFVKEVRRAKVEH